MEMYDALKKCPFNGEQTFTHGGRLKEECRKSECRFCISGRCVIVANFFMLKEIQMSLNSQR